MPSECARRRAPSTASGEQQLFSPSVSRSAQSLSVTATTSCPASRSRRAATAESTPPLRATRTRSPSAGRSASGAPDPASAESARWSASAARTGGVAMGGREPAELGLDFLRADPRGVQDRGALRQLGDRSGRGSAGGASLALEADALDRAVAGEQRDPDEVAAGSAAGGAREGTVGLGAAAGVVGEELLQEVSVHGFAIRSRPRAAWWPLSGSNLPSAAPAW